MYTEEDLVIAFNGFMTKMAESNIGYLINIITNEIYKNNYVIRISNGCLIDVDGGIKRANIHAPDIGDLIIDNNGFILGDIRKSISDELSSLMRRSCIMYAKSIIHITDFKNPNIKEKNDLFEY